MVLSKPKPVQSPSSFTDAALLEQFRSPEGQEQAFRMIVEKYGGKVYSLVRKMVVSHDDADDLVQETFIKVWKALPGFRSDSQLFTWIYRIATNECLNFLKKKKKRYFLSLNDVDKELIEMVDRESQLSGDEIQKQLQKALLKLPEKQRLVFNMRYFEELPYQTMSEVLGTSVGALKASYHIAVKKIEDNLSQH